MCHTVFECANGNTCLMSPIQAVTQIPHHHQVPAPLPLQMEAPFQGSLILIDHDHCELACGGECPALLYLLCLD